MKIRSSLLRPTLAVCFFGATLPGLSQIMTIPLSYYVAQVKNINPGAGNASVMGDGARLVELNGSLYFAADNGANGAELWKTSGTAASTALVKNINGSGASNPDWLTRVNGTLFFVATGPSGRELYKSDGTVDGTVLVKDIRVGGDANPWGLTAVNGMLFFVANNGTSGEELWKSDGTAAGTVLVKDIKPGAGGSVPNYMRKMAVLGGNAFLVADDGVNGEELWKTDGTEAGTVLVKNIHPTSSSNLFEMVVMNNLLYMTANDGTNGTELWKSDGTEAGTVLVKNLVAGSGSSQPQDLEAVGSTLFFRATVGGDTELYKSDGTAGGTVLAKNISASGSSFPSYLTNVNGTLYFSANDGTHGTELWKSDGTGGGTVMVEDLTPGSGSSSLTNLTAVNNRLFFQFNEPWKSSGTAASTAMLDNINPTGNSAATGFTALGSTVFFWATDGSTGMELYKYASCYICPMGRLAAEEPPVTATLQLSLRPNPVRHTITVDITNGTDHALQLHLTSLHGKTIENRQVVHPKAVEQQTFDVSGQPAGVMVLHVRAGDQEQTVKVLKTD
ncbi:ELWxxDGT repeat protein [Larkinella bovis]|uniref:ELWxxDGT repeat protein n=1 Tax=Larkinella bovis TaxID=683041 RepID=A0ABW0I5F9_9BACT